MSCILLVGRGFRASLMSEVTYGGREAIFAQQYSNPNSTATKKCSSVALSSFSITIVMGQWTGMAFELKFSISNFFLHLWT